MQIAICDDESADLELLTAILLHYKEKANIELSVFTFQDCNELLNSISRGALFDLIFFDILMPGLSGIETAKILRQNNSSAQLVFITISRDFAVDAFAVKARDYLLKPISEPTVFALLDEMGLEQEHKRNLVISTRDGLRNIYPYQLSYCEIWGHTVLWHLSSGAVFKSSGTMPKTLELLQDYNNFFQIHRSFLVNFDYISAFHRTDFTAELTNRNRLPVPKAKFTQVLNEYKQYMEKRGNT